MYDRGRFVAGLAAAAVVGLLATACTSDPVGSPSTNPDATNPDATTPGTATPGTATPGSVDAGQPAEPRVRFRYPAAPDAPDHDVPSAPEALAAIGTINQIVTAGELDLGSVATLAATGDVRHAWYLADLLRFFGGEQGAAFVDAFESLSGVTIAADPDSARSPWLSVTNHLIAWDTPDYPSYREDKAGIFLLLEPAWEPFFTDADATIDWRVLSWGGVFIDDRELGDTRPCPGGCIPALDDPATTDAGGGDWYPDEMIVFGVVEGDETLAIPKNVAEIHEMFNFTLGGRRFGLPYCTLCGSAQAYYTDNSGAAEQPVLRTSGLLSRSNKVMYDLVTMSVFDTFTGAAVSGPLQDLGVVLEEATVVRSTWGEWKAAHPGTRIIAEDGGIGRSYELDPLRGRDADGPIFPIGPADDRLDVQELVVGVITADGTPIAFPSSRAADLVDRGEAVELGGVRVIRDGGGLRAIDISTGADIAAHEAFWFAWSQFHPDTLLFAR